MVNLTQVILVVVITTLTILLTFIGIQVVYILRDLRETVKRVNKIVDNAEAISSAVVKPITGLSSLAEGIQSSVKIAEILGQFRKGVKKAAHEIPERVSEVKEDVREAKERADEQGSVKIQMPRRRFFHRGGTPIGQ